ncbi:MAG: AbrB/MazE/SpoVT family DNA-binding domain-containing protein [Anaerolineae bacterium]
MRTKVTELGSLLEQMFEGVDEVEIRREQNTVVVVPIVNGNSTYDLNALLTGVTDENIHAEVDTGAAVGNEAW